MQWKRLEPGTSTYNAAISACEKGDQPDKAPGAPWGLAAKRPGTWQDHLQCGNQRMQKGRTAGQGLEPGMSTCNAAISACKKG